MADIARIGFSADTGALTDAKTKLDALSPSAAKTEKSVNSLNQELAETGNAAQQAAVGLDKATKATDRNTAANKRNSSNTVPSIAGGRLNNNPWAKGLQPVNDNIDKANKGLNAMRANTANIAAQFQDIGVTAAAGMNPLIIGLQQGTQLSAVFAASIANGESAIQALAASFRQVLGVTALFTIGIVAIAAALIQLVNWTKVAQVALNGMADVIETIAPYAVLAAAGLALLYAPAIIGGITLLSETILGLTARLAGLAIGFALANPALAFIAGFIAVVAAAVIFRDEITKLFGKDLVGAAKDGINLIVGAFKGAYEGIKAAWGLLPQAIGDIFIQVYNNVIDTLEKLINASIRGINTLVDFLPDWMKPDGGLITGKADFSSWKGEVSGAAKEVAGIFRDEMDKAIGPDYVGAVVDVISKGASNVADKLRNLASGLGKDTKKKKHGGKTDAEKFQDIITGANNQIATLKAQQDALGMTAEAAAELKYQTQLLNEAAQKNIKLTPEQTARLMALGKQMGDLEVATKTAAEALDFVKDGFKGFINDMASGLKQGQSFWEAFGNAALNVLDKIADKLLNDVLDAIFQTQKAAAGGLGGAQSGGFLGSVLGWIGGAFGIGGGGFSDWDKAIADLGIGLFAKGGAFANGISGYSNQVVNKPTMFAFASGAGLMGERGPEAVMPLTRMGNGDLGVQMSQDRTANDNAPIPVNININLKGANGDKQIAMIARQAVYDGLNEFNDSVLPGRVVEISNDPRAR